MSNLTTGPLSVQAMRITGSVTLADLAVKLNEVRPLLSTRRSGWGNPNDDDDEVNRIGGEATPNPVTVEPSHANVPEHLYGRFYWYELDTIARRAVRAFQPDEVDEEELFFRLRAFDIVVNLSATEGELDLFVTSRDKDKLDATLLPALRAALVSLDANARILPDTSPLDLVNHDFFLWLIRRYAAEPKLAPDLTLKEMRVIRSRDTFDYGTELSQGVDLARRELLALITNDSVLFGPAKMAVDERVLNAFVDFELFIDGGFTAHLTMCKFGQPMGRAAKGPAAFLALAYDLIPAMRTAYEADGAWRSHLRDDFRVACEQGLINRVRPTFGTPPALPPQP